MTIDKTVWGFSTFRHEDLASRFDQMDKDGNGILSPDEVTGVIRELMGYDEKTARYFVTMFDKNQDGSLDKAEFIHMWTDMFG
jgi:Ca2+-binding EF-hand superfamily protein